LNEEDGCFSIQIWKILKLFLTKLSCYTPFFCLTIGCTGRQGTCWLARWWLQTVIGWKWRVLTSPLGYCLRLALPRSLFTVLWLIGRFPYLDCSYWLKLQCVFYEQWLRVVLNDTWRVCLPLVRLPLVCQPTDSLTTWLFRIPLFCLPD